MPSDAASTPQSEPEATPEQYRQRALLLADLGRYDEAAEELAAGLAAAAGESGLLTTLARVHLAAEQPVEALTAADRAVAAAPGTVATMVARAMALADLRRFAEAAQIALEILQRWPDDAYAQRTGAALLSEARNGQDALNAAWTAVRLSPTAAEAHLVLAVVSARLRLFDLAQRAYGEALELDPLLGEAQHDVGVVRLERRRWSKALEQLADAAALAVPVDGNLDPDGVSTRESSPAAGPAVPFAVSRPAGPVLDTFAESAATIQRGVRYGASGLLTAALLAAIMATASAGASRVWAVVVAVVVVLAVVGWLRRQLTDPLAATLRRVRRGAPRLALAAYAVPAAALLLMAYAAVGGPVPLVAALVAAAAAQLLVLIRRD